MYLNEYVILWDIHHVVTDVMVGYTPVHVISLVLDPLTSSLIEVAIQNKL